MQTLRGVLVQMKGIWSRLDGGQKLVAWVLFMAIAAFCGIVWYAAPSHERATANTNRPARSEPVAVIDAGATSEQKLDAEARAQAVAAIAALDGVIAVNVTASRPQHAAASPDRDDEVLASAVLRLAPGVPFEPIARSAASLAAAQLLVPLQNIEILSASGNQRWRYDRDREAGGGSAEFLRLQRSLGEERTQLAQQRLDQLWPGKTSIAVNLELDPTWETKTEKVLPEEAIVKSETRDSTDASGGSTPNGERSTGKSTKREREFVTDIGERRTGKMAPEIKRLTVALLYDRSLEQAPGFVEQDLVNAVKAIIGWDPARDGPEAFRTLAGDFAPIDSASMAGSAPGVAEVLLRWGPTIGPILGVLAAAVLLRRLFRRLSSPAVKAGAPAAAEVKEEDMSPEQQQEHMRREIERSIANDPTALARMLESWLGEQKA